MNATALAEINTIPQVVTMNTVREFARSKAASFDPLNGDSLGDYVTQAAYELYPWWQTKKNGERAEVKKLIRGFLRERRTR